MRTLKIKTTQKISLRWDFPPLWCGRVGYTWVSVAFRTSLTPGWGSIVKYLAFIRSKKDVEMVPVFAP